MAEIVNLAADRREQAGKGTARQKRRSGRVPGVIYGNKIEPIKISIDERDLQLQLRQGGFFSHVFELDVEGSKERVLARELQRDPVKGRPIHVDFMRFSAATRVEVEIEVVFENEAQSPGLKTGGVLNIVSHTVPVICRPDEIPERLTVDLTGLEIGDVIHLSKLAIPDSAEFAVSDPDATVATIAAPTLAPVEAEEEGVEEVAEAEEAGDEKDSDKADRD